MLKLFDDETLLAILVIIATFFLKEFISLMFQEYKDRKETKYYLLFFVENLKNNIHLDYKHALHVQLDQVQDKYIYIKKIKGLDNLVDKLLNIYSEWKTYHFLINTDALDPEKIKIVERQEKAESELEQIYKEIISLN